MDVTTNTKLTLAYVVNVVGKLHFMRRNYATELESAVLDRVSRVVTWTTQCDYTLERELFDLVDNSGGVTPLPEAVDWAVLSEFTKSMTALKKQSPKSADIYDESVKFLTKVLNRLNKHVAKASS